MKIALDYDGTYTEAPEVWRQFVMGMMSEGHEVMIVTFRPPHCPVDINGLEEVIDVYYTSAVPKRKYMESKGIHINIWIDDMPDLIVNESDWTDEEREKWKVANGY